LNVDMNFVLLITKKTSSQKKKGGKKEKKEGPGLQKKPAKLGMKLGEKKGRATGRLDFCIGGGEIHRGRNNWGGRRGGSFYYSSGGADLPLEKGGGGLLERKVTVNLKGTIGRKREKGGKKRGSDSMFTGKGRTCRKRPRDRAEPWGGTARHRSLGRGTKLKRGKGKMEGGGGRRFSCNRFTPGGKTCSPGKASLKNLLAREGMGSAPEKSLLDPEREDKFSYKKKGKKGIAASRREN